VNETHSFQTNFHHLFPGLKGVFLGIGTIIARLLQNEKHLGRVKTIVQN